jgi:UDPglucose--hexose-1-phosphate uridylyltransferase
MRLEYPHRRLNPLTGEWILISPHRARRPWLGQVEKIPPENLPSYDPTCYLCPGNQRVEGTANPQYTSTFVFDNDFQAILTPEASIEMGAPLVPFDKNTTLPPDTELFAAVPEYGICRVVCFSPRHDMSIPELSQGEVEEVVRTWSAQTVDLSSKDFISYVQVFENKGASMGASNPHPHSQIWSTSHIPNEPAKELRQQAKYAHEHNSCILCDVLKAELESGERVVSANEHFLAVVPFWAVWPFEVMLLSRRHFASMPDMTPEEVSGLADIMRRVTARYDNMFEIPFPYSMGFHQAPTDGKPHESWHFHAHYYPPLLRSATVRKFMVGFEMLGMPQRDLTAETSAERLRALSETHYRLKE